MQELIKNGMFTKEIINYIAKCSKTIIDIHDEIR